MSANWVVAVGYTSDTMRNLSGRSALALKSLWVLGMDCPGLVT